MLNNVLLQLMITNLPYPPDSLNKNLALPNSDSILSLQQKPNPFYDTIKQDTFFGIKNESKLPYRKETTTKSQPQSPQEILFNPTKNKVIIDGWQTLLLLTAFLLLGLTKAFANSRFKQSIRALINYGVALEINRDEKVFFHRGNILTTAIYLITSSLFLYHLKQVVNTTVLDQDNYLLYLLILGSILFIYSIKFLFSKVLFFVFNELSLSSEYIFNVSLYNNLLGIILIPVLSIIYFTSISFNTATVYLFIPIVAIVFLMRLLRLIVIGNSKGISYLYIFLYICTLEILPLVVMYRIFIHK